ncbi:hypothetical protein OHT20_00130 [Streptomyces caniferus]|uniref:Uncharacterized protein n=1 Tax=Streptomyces caniferus TaxID=285557 RepID=A0ABZ1VCA8_9ACTN|nr:hypothetical protein [Streptomyces caniferus]
MVAIGEAKAVIGSVEQRVSPVVGSGAGPIHIARRWAAVIASGVVFPVLADAANAVADATYAMRNAAAPPHDAAHARAGSAAEELITAVERAA